MSEKSPDAFRTISEVADWLGVQPHVLRFWESKFSQVRPVKRAGGRRYYRPNDMLLLGGIRKLLHEDGLTIKGAQKVLREEGMSHVASMSQPLDPESAALSDIMAEREEAEAQERATERQAGAPETGKLLEFESAQRSTAPVEVEPLIEDSEPTDSAAKHTEHEASAPPRPELSGSPDPKPDTEDVPADPSQAGSSPDETTEVPEGEHEPDETASDKTPMPAFIRSRSTPKAAETEDIPPEPSRPDRLPSFLQPPPSETEAPQASARTSAIEAEHSAEGGEDLESAPLQDDRQTSLPFADETPPAPESSGTAEPEASPSLEPQVQAAPKPRVVDIPDPDESAIEATSGTLSASFSATSMSSRQRAEILPVVAQLAALRDRMAMARGR